MNGQDDWDDESSWQHDIRIRWWVRLWWWIRGLWYRFRRLFRRKPRVSIVVDSLIIGNLENLMSSVPGDLFSPAAFASELRLDRLDRGGIATIRIRNLGRYPAMVTFAMMGMVIDGPARRVILSAKPVRVEPKGKASAEVVIKNGDAPFLADRLVMSCAEIKAEP